MTNDIVNAEAKPACGLRRLVSEVSKRSHIESFTVLSDSSALFFSTISANLSKDFFTRFFLVTRRVLFCCKISRKLFNGKY